MLINRSAQILACYRKNCASPSSPGQLILPECMKLLPLYINCLLNCDALSGGSDMSIDDRTFNMFAVCSSWTMPVLKRFVYFYFLFHFWIVIEFDDFLLGFQVRCVINQLRSTRQRHMRLTLVRPRDKLEFVFRKFLVEDKHGDASSSYVDFLCHLHKEIRNLLN